MGSKPRKKKNQEIIAYRVDDHFLCPECYETRVKISSVHGLDLPSGEPVKKGDIESFICQQCEKLKKLLEELGQKVPQTGSGVRDQFENENPKGKVIMASDDDRSTRELELNMLDEIIRMSRKAKFIRRTLHASCEGRSLSRKNILTLRNFFDNLGERLDTVRLIITNSILGDILLPRSLRDSIGLKIRKGVTRFEFVPSLLGDENRNHPENSQ